MLREDAADDHRSVRIATEELDEHLLTDARNDGAAEARAGPRLVGRDPARAQIVSLALAVPMKVNADARIFVGVDLVARRADDGGALDPLHARLRCHRLGTERRLGTDRVDVHPPITIVLA